MTRLLTEEQHKFLIDNYKGKGNVELTNLINETFGTNFKISQIKSYKNNRSLNSGITGRFEKGQKSWNKGKKWNEYLSIESQKKCLTTCYKKGNVADNADPIGTEKIKHSKRGDIGFIYVKVCDGKRQHNWKPKHHIIWEKENGKVPNGYKVIFKDGDRFNFDINNLALVSNSEMLILNKHNLIYSNKEITESGIIIAKMLDKCNGLKRNYGK